MCEELTTFTETEPNNLTVEELNRVFELLPDKPSIVGVKVHPADLEYMAEQVGVNHPTNAMFVTPLYSLKVFPDITIPRGMVEPIRG